jgi:hypothetical protein
MIMGIVSPVDAALTRRMIADELLLSFDTRTDKHAGLDDILRRSVTTTFVCLEGLME